MTTDEMLTKLVAVGKVSFDHAVTLPPTEYMVTLTPNDGSLPITRFGDGLNATLFLVYDALVERLIKEVSR